MSSSRLEEFCLQMTETHSAGLNPEKGLGGSAGHGRGRGGGSLPPSPHLLFCVAYLPGDVPTSGGFLSSQQPWRRDKTFPRSSSESLRTGFHWL